MRHIHYLFKTGSNVAATNLDIVYGDTKSTSEKEAIYRASLINFGHVIINYMRLPFAGEVFWTKHCELVNEDVLKKAANQTSVKVPFLSVIFWTLSLLNR